MSTSSIAGEAQRLRSGLGVLEGACGDAGFRAFVPPQAAPLPAVRISEAQKLRFTREAEVALGLDRAPSCSLAYSRSRRIIRITVNRSYRPEGLALRRSGTLYLNADRFVRTNGIVERGEFPLLQVGKDIYEARTLDGEADLG